MKTIILFVFIVLVSNLCHAQEPSVNEILKRVNENVTRIYSGEYKLHDKYILLNVGEDTTVSKETISNYYYKKDTRDSLLGYDFAIMSENYEKIYNGTSLFYKDYTGTLTITDAYKFPNEIKRKGQSNNSFFMQSANSRLQNNLKFKQPILLLGTEDVYGKKCYKIQLGRDTDRSLVQYYISSDSFLPIKSTVILTHINNKAKRIQIFNDWITDIKINTIIPDKRFSKSALSKYNEEEQFAGSKAKPARLLPIGSAAPDWELPTLNNKIIKLSDLTGKIVIMDFWFKACIPCQQQMIDLEALNKKYAKKDVVIIGINTIDDPAKSKLSLFLQNRKITMLSAYNGKNIEPLYNAYTSPVLYIIGKNGKIIYSLDGESETLISDVSKIIDQNL